MGNPLSRLFMLAAVILLWICSPASAHHTPSGPQAGLSIPGLTHGQMVVIADYRREILALADAQKFRSDETFFRLRNYVDLQYLYCAWGLVPGSVTDDASPFNGCSHAYLAGARALLLHMQTMPGDQSRVHALVDRIERAMLANNASLVLCQYSNEPFNTADHIGPRWGEVPFHGPSIMTFAAFAGLSLGGIWGGGRLLRTMSA
jgi:hypothetical protein